MTGVTGGSSRAVGPLLHYPQRLGPTRDHGRARVFARARECFEELAQHQSGVGVRSASAGLGTATCATSLGSIFTPKRLTRLALIRDSAPIILSPSRARLEISRIVSDAFEMRSN